jgi:hypothetical protein
MWSLSCVAWNLKACSFGWFYDNQNQEHVRHWILTNSQTTLTYTLVIAHKTHMEIKTYTTWIESQDALKELNESRENKQRYLEVGRQGIKGKQTQTMGIQIIKGR